MTTDNYTSDFPELLPAHLEMLRRESGIADEFIKARGAFSIKNQKDNHHLAAAGFAVQQRRAPGLVLPIHTTDGQRGPLVYRPDHPRIVQDGGPPALMSPRLARLFIYRDDDNGLWAARVPAEVGNHPLLGFEPTNRTDLLRYPIRYTFVGAVRPRHILLRAPKPDKANWPYERTVPVGSLAAFAALRRDRPVIELSGREWSIGGIVNESATPSRGKGAPG